MRKDQLGVLDVNCNCNTDPVGLLKSLVLPELGYGVSDILDEDADGLAKVVLEAAEHGPGGLGSVLNKRRMSRMRSISSFSLCSPRTWPRPWRRGGSRRTSCRTR